MGLLDSLAQAIGNKQGSPQFSDIAQDAPNDVLAKGITAAFNSDQTPAIGNMVSQLFAQSNGAQQAGMLNQLMTSLGPAVMGSLAGGTLAKVMTPGQAQITPAQASQLTPQQVQDQLGAFYAEHRGLINTLGGIAATVAMMKMQDHLSGRA